MKCDMRNKREKKGGCNGQQLRLHKVTHLFVFGIRSTRHRLFLSDACDEGEAVASLLIDSQHLVRYVLRHNADPPHSASIE